MPKTTVVDLLLERLREWGVAQVFSYPGDGINQILAAFGRTDNKEGIKTEAEQILPKLPR